MAESATERELLDQYGPRMNAKELAAALRYKNHVSILNKVCRGTFEIPTYREGRHRYASTRDVARYLDRRQRSASSELQRIRRETGQEGRPHG